MQRLALKDWLETAYPDMPQRVLDVVCRLPQYNKTTVEEFLRIDSHYRAAFVWVTEHGVPLFIEDTLEEKLRLYFDELILAPQVPYTRQEFTTYLEQAAAASGFGIFTLPATFLVGPNAEEEAVESRAYLTSDRVMRYSKDQYPTYESWIDSYNSKQRNSIKKANEDWNEGIMIAPISNVLDYVGGAQSPFEAMMNIVRDQAIYWKMRDGVSPDDYEYAIRLWMWQTACLLTDMGKVFVLHRPQFPNRNKWVSAVGLIEQPHMQSAIEWEMQYVYTAFALNSKCWPANNIGIASLMQTAEWVRNEGGIGYPDYPIRLGVSADEFTQFQYMVYKKTVANDSLEVSAFAATLDGTTEIRPPFYAKDTLQWKTTA